jgi:predicted RNase H-like HicB family nuclease
VKIKIVVHEAEVGFWAEVPAIPGCATIEVALPEPGGVERMLEL